MTKGNVTHTSAHTIEYYLVIKKGGNIAIHNNMNETGGDFAK